MANTLGVFEDQILEIARIIHAKGGYLYCDGANFNAYVGVAKPGRMGVGVMQMNLHKTFSTPHGGGAPGSGPVAVVEALVPFLPRPTVERCADGTFFLDFDRPESIGRLGLEAFIHAMREIARECGEDPDVVRTGPHTTPVKRVDEVGAARNLVLRWKPGESRETGNGKG